MKCNTNLNSRNIAGTGVEDITFGFGKEPQVRNGKLVEITQVNSSHVPYDSALSVQDAIERNTNILANLVPYSICSDNLTAQLYYGNWDDTIVIQDGNACNLVDGTSEQRMPIGIGGIVNYNGNYYESIVINPTDTPSIDSSEWRLMKSTKEELKDLNEALKEALNNSVCSDTISLLNESTVTVELNSGEYIEFGAVARDCNGNTLDYEVTGNVDSYVAGVYHREYSTESGVNIVRNVVVRDTSLPYCEDTIELIGDSTVFVKIGSNYTDKGVIALDCDNNNVNVTVTGNLNTDSIGTYTLEYTTPKGIKVYRTVKVVETLPNLTIEDVEKLTAEQINKNNTVIYDIDDLSNIDTANSSVTLIGSKQGGIFYYDPALSEVNNGGTIIDGWVRQYTGNANLEWFGEINNINTWIKADKLQSTIIVPDTTTEINLDDTDYLFGSKFVSLNRLNLSTNSNLEIVYLNPELPLGLDFKTKIPTRFSNYSDILISQSATYFYPQSLHIDKSNNILYVLFNSNDVYNTDAVLVKYIYNTGVEVGKILIRAEGYNQNLVITEDNNLYILNEGNVDKYNINQVSWDSTFHNPTQTFDTNLTSLFYRSGRFYGLLNVTKISGVTVRTSLVLLDINFKAVSVFRALDQIGGGIGSIGYKQQGMTIDENGNTIYLIGRGIDLSNYDNNLVQNYLGVVKVSSEGSITDSALYTPKDLADLISTLDEVPTRVEYEGITLTSDNELFALLAIHGSSDENYHLIVELQSNKATSKTLPLQVSVELGNYDNIIAQKTLDGKLTNPLTSTPLTNIIEICEMMKQFGTYTYSFYSSFFPNLTYDGVLPIPSSTPILIRQHSNSYFTIESSRFNVGQHYAVSGTPLAFNITPTLGKFSGIKLKRDGNMRSQWYTTDGSTGIQYFDVDGNLVNVVKLYEASTRIEKTIRIEQVDGKLELKSPNGSLHKIGVTDAGAIVVT